MSKNIKAIRGMHDILPQDSGYWQYFERSVERILGSYGYREIRMPLLESTALFKRSIGEVTDIVEKEMYSFADRNGDSLTLRPEGTASCVRAGIEHGLLYNQTPRLWYQGPMFRHERPQKGRYRQFYQMGVEAFGMPGPDIDIELILLSRRIWQEVGIKGLTLEINSLGSADERHRYRDELLDYLSAHKEHLDEDSLRRLHTNPLRILDSKNPAMQDMLEQAPRLQDSLGEESRQHFERICQALDEAGIDYRLNSRLVRGLDYYNYTVFEWVTSRLGAQATVCAGGRFDGLVEQLGGRATPAVGFALGMERVLELLREDNPSCGDAKIDVFVVVLGQRALEQAAVLLEPLRAALPDQVIQMHCGAGSFKSQFKKADKSGARWAIILADDELDQARFGLKNLRQKAAQESLTMTELLQRIKNS
ncbi:MAG: histidine--tRNA ligase [gamma proteobacterium symbiont of Bathyaustriella thionipta]|nr:histidine--tRNA ligase [gamma proteobacterium symbiont of Bathyaustriella thionipta]